MTRPPRDADPLSSDGGKTRIPDQPPEPDGLDRFLERANELLRDDEARPYLPAPGFQIGGYRLIRRLGHGGMGVVWLAEDETLGRRVALKLLPPHLTFDPEAVWRFRQEASATARLAHPNIVTVFAAGEEQGQRYLAMEYVEGVPLDRLLARLVGRRPGDTTLRDLAGILALECPAMSEATAELRAEGGAYVRAAATWVAQAADALAHAHGKGVLHRDIKPSNLLLDVKGHVRVVDFGLAQVEEAAPVTRTGAILGTLTYMAPEALLGQRGRADARADIYSLGAVLYEILAFQPPFLSDSLHALVQEVHTGEPPRLRAVHRGAPRDLMWITEKCLAKEPHHRYATAGDLADDLRRFLDGRSVRARPAGPVRRLRYWARRRPARALLLGLALAAGALAWPVARLVESAKVKREAGAERRLAATKLDEHRAGRAALAKQRAEFSLRKGVGEIAPGESGGATRAHWERRLFEMEIDLARALEAARAALDRAARLEASTATADAFAEHYLYRYELAEQENDPVLMELWREALLASDRTGRQSAKLLGEVSLTVGVEPEGAEIFLYRYEPYETFRKEAVPRLVPVPTAGRGRCRAGSWVETFCPGDPCLLVTAVAPDSPGARAGVEPGDLVLTIQGSPSPKLFVARVLPGPEPDRAAIRVWDAIREIDGRETNNERDWREVAHVSLAKDPFIRVGQLDFFLRAKGPLPQALGVEAAGAERILGFPAPEGGGKLGVLHRGELREIAVPAGMTPGLTSEITAYPLILSPENRIPRGVPVQATPGSYVVCAHAPGFEEQRFPIRVPRGRDVGATVRLQPAGSTPAGFVWIPAGLALLGGDPDWNRDDGVVERELPGYYIRRTELTLGEWFEFVNDPESLALIEAARAEGRTIRLPRHYNHPFRYAKRLPDGRWEPDDPPDVPVYGISGADVKDFLLWRNARAEARGDPWLWAIPKRDQWAKAARGADGRFFPWGNRFDVVFIGTQQVFEKDRPCRSEPRDESPFGVADLGGSCREWVEAGTALRGGSWGGGDPRFYRASYEDWTGEGYVNHTCGFRPILVPRGSPR